jgi:hypothetical protein
MASNDPQFEEKAALSSVCISIRRRMRPYSSWMRRVRFKPWTGWIVAYR